VPVPQAPSSLPKGYILVRKIPDVQLRVGGARDAVNNFDPTSDVTIKVDWRGISHGGVQSIPISVDDNDPNVELLDAPTSVEANVDTVGSVTVPVAIKVTGNPPAGILLGSQSASPSSVSVQGPSHELTGIEVRASVDLSNVRSNFQQDTQLFAFDTKGNALSSDVELQPNVVRVTILLSSSVTSRVVAVQPSIVGRVASGYALTAIRYTPQSITLSGPQDLLNNIDAVSTSNVSINGLTGNVSLSVQLQLPDGVSASVGTITINLVVTPITPATPVATPTPTPTPSPT